MTFQPRILLLAGGGFLHAYGGTLYLLEALRAEGAEVSVVVHDPPETAPAYAKLAPGCRLLYPETRRPGPSRRLLRRLALVRDALRQDALLITEYFFIPEAIAAKRLRPRLFLAHYCQELRTPQDYPTDPGVARCLRLGALADVVLDVEPHRAESRRAAFGLQELPWVLPNTVPAARVPPPAPAGTLARLAGQTLPTDRPILIHAGGIGAEKPLERVIDAVQHTRHPVFFLAFCYGAPSRIREVQDYAAQRLQTGAYLVSGPRPREEIAACLGEADVGVVDYAPSVEPTQNQLYCAPTKLYEFMAAGLALLTSANPSLAGWIRAEELGESARGDSPAELAAALDRLLADPTRLRAIRARARQAFMERHCYEKIARPTVQRLLQTLRHRTRGR